MNRTAFKFGAFERVIGTVFFITLWSMTMVAVIVILTNHGDPTPETARAIELAANTGLAAIALLFWGRPVFYGLRQVVNRARSKYAQKWGAA